MVIEVANFIIKRIKGDGYYFDKTIPISYILRLFFGKLLSLFYGCLRLWSFKKRVFIHPDTTIKCANKIRCGNNLVIERKCYIDALSKEGLVFGDNVSLGYQTFVRITGSIKEIGRGIRIGNNVGLGTHGYYGCGVGYLEIGNDCIFGNYVSIHPENHNYSDVTKPIRLQGVNSRGGVKIGSNCWIGAKVTILDGTIIGNGCIVAAGSVVHGEFPDNVIIGGIPAKIIKQRV